MLSQRQFRPKVMAFGYKDGGVPSADLVLDVRSIPNPFNPHISDEQIRERVLKHPLAEVFIRQGVTFLTENPGKTVAIGCTYGLHRSYAIAREILARVT